MGQYVVQLLEIGLQILQPEGGALAHGHQLRGLKMRVAQAGHVGMYLSAKSQRLRMNGQQFAPEIAQRVAVEDEIGVVGDIAARRAQMDDARARREPPCRRRRREP
jgi:hypothetical protein